MVAVNPPFDREVCAVCGRDTAGGQSFMRVYVERGRLDFCTPGCATHYTVTAVPGGSDLNDPAAGGWHAWAVRWSRWSEA